ncbi:hypothetical protein SO802_032911 [Lithocarpus litseifolius]|uniref:Pentatricopeptide repeat-containing protein n=1 Tax=Lithocarpus litseifolius TaxID=425828 RepID=A0AAW2BBK1_9ROSI
MADFAMDYITISSVLGAVALLNRSGIGTHLHAYIAKLGLDSDVSIGSSLMTKYSKFGNVGDCHKAFDHVENLDLIGWTTMILNYAQHGWENLSFGF